MNKPTFGITQDQEIKIKKFSEECATEKYESLIKSFGKEVVDKMIAQQKLGNVWLKDVQDIFISAELFDKFAIANTDYLTPSKEKSYSPHPFQDIVCIERFITEYAPLDYLIDQIIEERRKYTLTAPTGTGKTAIGLKMAECVALGKPFGKHVTKQVGVLFMAGENYLDVMVRSMAMIEANPALKTAPLYFCKGAFDVVKDIAIIKNYLKNAPEIKLVIIDTLQAYNMGDDSNNNSQMMDFSRGMDKLLDEGVSIIIPAHPTKNPTKDRNEPYGGGSFVNSMDGNLALWKIEENLIEFYWCKKFRGSFEPFTIELEKVEVNTALNSKGYPLSTIVCSVIDSTREEAIVDEAQKNRLLVLNQITVIKSSGRSKINKSEIARKLNWYFAKPDKDGFKRPDDTKVQRCIDTLIVDKLLSQNQVGIHLTKEGKEVVKNIDSLLGW